MVSLLCKWPHESNVVLTDVWFLSFKFAWLLVLDSAQTINGQKRVRDFATDEKMRGVVHAQIDFRIRLLSQSPFVLDAKACYLWICLHRFVIHIIYKKYRQFIYPFLYRLDDNHIQRVYIVTLFMHVLISFCILYFYSFGYANIWHYSGRSREGTTAPPPPLPKKKLYRLDVFSTILYQNA